MKSAKPRAVLSLRTIVICIALIAILPTLAFSAYLLLRHAETERKLAERTLIESTRGIANAVDAKFLAAESALLVLRESVLLEADTLTEFERRVRGAAAQTGLTFVLIDRSGQQLINTEARDGAMLGVSDVETWSGVFEEDATVYSDVILGPTTGRLLAAVGVPVHRDGTVRWALTAELFSDDFEPIIREPGVPRDWIVSIVDGNGIHLIRSHNNDEFAGKPLVEQLVHHMQGGNYGTLRTVSLEGIDLISNVEFARRSGWAAAVGLPVEALEAPVYRSLRDLAAIGFVAGGIAIALALFTARALNRAFGSLTSAAAAVGRGEVIAPSHTVVHEINSVSEVLATTSRDLDMLTSNLEDLVAERTRSLSETNAALKAEMERRQESEFQLRQIQKLEAVGQLTGGIAHDFNNMMSVVLSALSLIKRRLGKGERELDQYIDGARQAAEKAANLTTRLLAFSRQQALAPEAIDLHDLFSELQEMLKRTLPESISIKFDIPTDVWPIFADRHSFENAFLNLAINARDAMPDGGTLTFEAANASDVAASEDLKFGPGDYVRISVSDTGVGISDEILDKVFDPFFTTKQAGEGTGLGLSQVHGFVSQSKGHIEIDSKDRKGTVVRLFFPRSGPDVKTSGPDARATEAVQLASQHNTVLVVEDDPIVREMTVAMVEELGLRVIEAADAATALSKLELHSDIDILLTDIVMPGMDGKCLAETARHKYPNLVVLFVTGYAKDSGLGVMEFDPELLITKPFTLETLSTKLRSALRQRKETNTPQPD